MSFIIESLLRKNQKSLIILDLVAIDDLGVTLSAAAYDQLRAFPAFNSCDQNRSSLMQPPEDVKADLAEELYGDSLRLSKPATNDYSLENLDGSLNGSWDEEPSEIRELDREWERRRDQFHTAGYRDGIIAGKEAISQQGFNIGFKESVLAGYKFGIVRGVSSALAFLSDELRQKLCDEQETREKFQNLQNSVNILSTEDALKVFYGAMVTKQGEEKKSGEEGSSSSGSGSGVTDLGSYVSELSSLLDKSPKIEVRLDTDRKLV